LPLDTVIVGAGPSGLAAAHEMTRHGAQVAVLERLDTVGGLSRTLINDGCRFDIGPHRFFTRNQEVNQLFKDVVDNDLLHVSRLTRIFYNNKYFNYPLTPLNALFGVGIGSSFGILGSYASTRLRRRLNPRPPANFEEWVSDQFGEKLFRTFFKTYTEKVWGIPCTQIGADWAGQRIKGLSLIVAIMNALSKGSAGKAKTLVDEFMYPRLGAGQLYEKMAAIVESRGSQVLTGRKVLRLRREGFRVREAVVQDERGNEEVFEAGSFLSSAPLTQIVESMFPAAPDNVLAACRSLRYRDHLGVHLKLLQRPFPDNWIYIHSAKVRMARIANYRNFSPWMADTENANPVTIEYFCFRDDDLWSRSDEALVEFAVQELGKMNLAKPSDVVSGFVARSKRAYPVIEIGYQEHVDVIKSWLDQFENLLPIGRSGMFKYNNQDHAMATGLLAARRQLGLGNYDPWLVNIDAEYHEGGAASSEENSERLPETTSAGR